MKPHEIIFVYKNNWYLQNCLTPFIKQDFLYWLSFRFSILSFRLWAWQSAALFPRLWWSHSANIYIKMHLFISEIRGASHPGLLRGFCFGVFVFCYKKVYLDRTFKNQSGHSFRVLALYRSGTACLRNNDNTFPLHAL